MNFRSAFCATALMALMPTFGLALNEVHPCDEYAAHPDDPFRWAPGVLDEEIIPGAAIHFCTLAVEENPGIDRFVFQLGRAQWAGLQYADGLTNFFALHEGSGYGPAYAYLADAYALGIGGLAVDEDLALQLYEVSADAGFLPAIDVLAALEGGETVVVAESTPAPAPSAQQPVQQIAQQPVAPAQVARQTAEKPFDAAGFFESKVMQAMHGGNLKAAKLGKAPYMDADKSFFYLSGFLEPFQENYNIRDPNCIDLANPTLVRILNTKIAGSIPGMGGMIVGNGRSLEQNLNAGADMGFKMMGDMLKGLNSGQGMLGSGIGDMAAVSLLKQHGDKDARRLIASYSCGSDVTQRIMANISVYVTGRGTPMVSEAERTRQAAEIEAEKAREEQARQNEIRVAARSSCKSQFKNDAFCGCVVKGLDEAKIGNEDWFKVTTDFRQVVAVGKAYPQIGATIRSCRSE
jgi:hypothetical protein